MHSTVVQQDAAPWISLPVDPSSCIADSTVVAGAIYWNTVDIQSCGIEASIW